MTLRSILTTVTGLYREPARDRGYLPQELLSRLSDEVLGSPVRLEKLGSGVYRISAADGYEPLYVLYSRRRHLRPAA